ncbi:MAG: class I SAM-dependent methyltransferase [Minisyncoccota bacterium]
MTDPYYASRYVWNKDRDIVWKEIVRYLNPYLKNKNTILDLGSGYCDFINNVEAKERIAVDMSPDSADYTGEGVRFIQSVATDLSGVNTQSVDVVFASNLLEHLTDNELDLCMKEVKRVLKSGGLFISMQPNYRYSYKTYYDDPTHKKVFSDTALESFLISYQFEIVKKMPKFLPFSLKSRPSIIPVHPLIIRSYLNSPIKPFAGQMLFVVKKI